MGYGVIVVGVSFFVRLWGLTDNYGLVTAWWFFKHSPFYDDRIQFWNDVRWVHFYFEMICSFKTGTFYVLIILIKILTVTKSCSPTKCEISCRPRSDLLPILD